MGQGEVQKEEQSWKKREDRIEEDGDRTEGKRELIQENMNR